MKTMKLNLLEKREMNAIHGGKMKECKAITGQQCDYSAPGDFALASYEEQKGLVEPAVLIIIKASTDPMIR